MKRFSGGFVMALHEMPPERLTEYVEAIRPMQAVTLTELLQRSRQNKSTAGLFAISVDDGVGDTVRGLARLCISRSWPVTFYVPTHYLDTGEPMPFQRWRWLKPLLPRRKMALRTLTVDGANPQALRALSREIERMWYVERPEKYVPLIMELSEVVEREHGISAASLPTPAPISWAEAAELSRNPLISFESHGVTHAAMSALTEEELAFEMSHSQEVISEHTGGRCRHLCYPFGNQLSIGTVAPKVARRYYDSAVTMHYGCVDGADSWMLPRIPLYPSNSVRFARAKVLLGSVGLRRRWSLRNQDRSAEAVSAVLPSLSTNPTDGQKEAL